MTKFIKLWCLCCLMMVGMMTAASAQSLWPDDGNGMELFADRKARGVGDSLTIIINESSRATRSGSSSNSKSGSTNLASGVGIFDFLAAASASGSDSFNANGSITNSNNVSGRITVQVVEVQPNGNLVISGTQSIKQNKDIHKINITGVVRRDDITPENTVQSSLVADAELKFDGKGPINAKQRQGILTQIFNILF